MARPEDMASVRAGGYRLGRGEITIKERRPWSLPIVSRILYVFLRVEHANRISHKSFMGAESSENRIRKWLARAVARMSWKQMFLLCRYQRWEMVKRVVPHRSPRSLRSG